ncbi:MAG: SAM hydrolase/SAM-dependent halogenase family protein, partial [Ilumatobacteraceae bacterium]
AIPYVAEGVILAVVDPGVGTSRRAVAVEVADGAGVLLGPDNGLLAPAVAVAGGAERTVELANPAYQLDAPGSTFAGRDVFAPAAAHLCNGVDLEDLGPSVDPITMIPGMVPLPRQETDGIHAEVLWVDRFGNCQLNVGPEDLPAGVDAWRIVVSGDTRVARIETAFGHLATGSLGLVIDSQGVFALALDRHSAAAELEIGVGDAVVLSVLTDDATDAGAPMTTPVELQSRR